MPPSPTSPLPTIGAAILLSNGPRGWDPPALLLPSPLVLLRFSRGLTRLHASAETAPFHTTERPPLMVLQEVLEGIRVHLPKAGPLAGKPAFPLAVVAAAYEFGRQFAPHEQAFPHAAELRDDELFASVFIDAYRPDTAGGTERLGYAGAIPEGWMPGGPRLETAPPGHTAPAMVPHAYTGKGGATPLVPGVGRDEYTDKVQRIMEYLAAGDIYQANLTVPMRGYTTARAEDLFDRALKRGGATYAGLLITPGATVLSFSPELYLRRRGTRIETHPIKGTLPIPPHAGGVSQATEALTTSAKDRAEHVMIVDLERNDLGRLCVPGSITVDPLMQPVEHPLLLHLESRVKGTLRAGVTMNELFAATFPGGSVTGAPKKRALEILAELETGPRGIYCGAFGWIDAEGDCDLNLPIRTAVLRPDGEIEFHSGGGIVADSDPAGEWEELLTKARFFEGVLDIRV